MNRLLDASEDQLRERNHTTKDHLSRRLPTIQAEETILEDTAKEFDTGDQSPIDPLSGFIEQIEEEEQHQQRIEEEEKDLDVYIENHQSQANLGPLVTGSCNEPFERAKDLSSNEEEKREEGRIT